MVIGLQASFDHPQNGMTLHDMLATNLVADRLGEVIIFRSTGPWAKRWLKRKYPSKNFHVKGKSSDWGPHAGLVPYDGVYSKVGYDEAKAKKGTAANDDGLHSKFAGKQVLVLDMDQILEQLNDREGSPKRAAIEFKHEIPNSNDFLLIAKRSGDGKQVAFRAFQRGTMYEIRVYPQFGVVAASPHRILDADPQGKRAVPLEVMTSNEVGAGKPMTGDYDLLAVCPAWAQYGSLAARDIVKPGIELTGGGLRKGLAFRAGQGMDNVMDPRLHTMGPAKTDYHEKNRALNPADYRDRQALLRLRMQTGQTGHLSADSLKAMFDGSKDAEHEDMGNLTPRILRCINELNVQMGAVGSEAALRRVHHNAESHRFRLFGALTGKDMVTMKDGESYGDGFPLTVFQPSSLNGNSAVARYSSVCTLETLPEFKTYAAALKSAGYYVPKNWIWGV
jgi:hypothetical protein